MRKVYIILIFTLGALVLQNCTLSRGFDALKIYNYFQAKTNFEKVEKRHPVAAKYGLSLIQQKANNPFYNIDSAYKNITYAVVYFDSLKPKTKDKYAELGVDKTSIEYQQSLIATDLYKRALLLNSEVDFQMFIRQNPTSLWASSAVFKRDSLYFDQVLNNNSAAEYQKFMDKYPNSDFYADALKRFDRQLYVEHTSSDELKEYISFLKQYPANPFVIDAENQIYRIETIGKSVASYESFINRHPKNRNIREAWGQMYDAYLTENLSSSAIADFIDKFPENPFKHQLESDLALSKTMFYPVQNDGKWGFKSQEGKYVIASTYDYVEPFSEGLAMVVKNDKVGFITKVGQVKVDFNFDDALPFSEGCAVVEVSEKFGMINRQGEFIISPEYEFLGDLKNGLIPFEKDGLYGYFDKKGQMKIAPIFDEAYNFKDSIAKVSINNNWGIINVEGKYVFDPVYQFVVELKTNRFALQIDDAWGLLNINKDTVLNFIYDDISISSDEYFMVTVNDSFNFTNNAGELLLKKSWLPTYSDYKILGQYENNPILVQTGEGFNFISVDGKTVFRTAKADLGKYSNIVAYKKEALWGYLTVNPAKEVVKPQFNKALSFEYGYGIVSLSPLWGTVDSKGNFIIDAYYEDLQFLNNDVILAKGKGNYGLLSALGDTILPFSSLKIEPFADNIVKVSNQENVSYYNYTSSTWIRKED